MPAKKTFPIRVMLSVGALLLLLGGFAYGFHTWQNTMEQQKQAAIQLGQSAAALLPRDVLAEFIATSGGEESEAYQKLWDKLRQYRSINDGIQYAYIYTMKDGIPSLLVGAGPTKWRNPSLPRWDAATEAAFTMPFTESAAAVNAPVNREKTAAIQVLVPIYQPETGIVIAALATEYEGALWRQNALLQLRQTIVIVVCFLFLLLAISSIWRKNADLTSVSRNLEESEILLQTIFDQVPIGIAIGRDYRLISHINRAFETIAGRSAAELMKLDWTEFTHPDDIQDSIKRFGRFKAAEFGGFTFEKRLVKPDGSTVWVHMILAKLQSEEGDPDRYLCLAEDITGQMESERSLMESERSRAILLSHLPGMAYRCKYDKDWTILFASDGCLALTGYRPEDLLYNRVVTYNSLIVPKHRAMIWEAWKKAVATRTTLRLEYQIITADGRLKWVMEAGQGIYNEQNRLEALEGIIIDITTQKEQQRRIEYLSDYDCITGLHSRLYFDKKKAELNRSGVFPLSVIVADINGLKLINDGFGLQEGDRIIQETANILLSCCRESDILARTGGDDFTILLPDTDNETAAAIQRMIRTACQNELADKNKDAGTISLSMGWSSRQSPEEGIDDIIKRATEAMSRRKLLNRNSAHSAILSSIMATMYARSQETEEHSERMIILSRTLGMKLNLSQQSLDELELYALLHDIGKVGIDDRILNKPGRLTKEEWEIMKRHSEIGYQIIMSCPDLKMIAEYVLCHHERWDGYGYPRGLKGTEIPLLSRILAVVDAYDAMTENRLYRKAMSQREAIAEIRANAGTQFDPKAAHALIEILQS